MAELTIIGRLTTQRFMHNGRLVESREFRLLKRRSNGELRDIIMDPCVDIYQINFSAFEDGLYEIITTNHGYCLESGLVDDYELTLQEVE